ncbi:Predicted nucleotide-binding protein containing TIR-like domain-containing protein [Clostridium cavendishii DSM 21758]|uniref:Predicted nucleotide-binding protein containing TIR-like domain-containing protein n=1 Tax=Clostridium cavendishii DSM 21758 TaxID=1121302 RepID=A0A1M6GFC0_9CLOT|nr:TIR domain-containing protein [Clostridium cavendishii]SHJ08650.1 Predicted nucleotide-binding protein containing TIR-like domain-containing protein [Clostridium cavendishii DSM 21758]
MKTTVFIIYSNNGDDYARALQEEIKDISYSVLEKHLLSMPMQNKLDKLVNQLNESDFGIVIVTENYLEDKNIMFLIGLLIGNLGIGRFSLLMPNNITDCALCDYLKGFELNYYDINHPNKKAAISQAIDNIKNTLMNIEKRKKIKDYTVLENKKELLRIALDSYGETKERYNPFLAKLVEVFNSGYKLIKSETLGATIFEAQGDRINQIATAGIIKNNHSFSIDEDDKYVVQCHKHGNKVMLSEKVGRFLDDENVYEYIFYKSIHKKYILTIHIKCDCKIRDSIYKNYLEALIINNAGYISVLQLFLKGGNAVV